MGGPKKIPPKNGLGEFLGVSFWSLFRSWRPPGPRKHQFEATFGGGFAFGSDFGVILGQLKDVCGSQNIVSALEMLQKSHFHLSWIFDRFGLHLEGHSGAIWGPKLPFDSPSGTRGAENGGVQKRDPILTSKKVQKGSMGTHDPEEVDNLINK